MSKTTSHPQNDQRQKMLPRDWDGCQVRIIWSAIGGANGRTVKVVEALCPCTSSIAINAWILLDDPIVVKNSNDVTLIPVQINGACDQLEILKARGER